MLKRHVSLRWECPVCACRGGYDYKNGEKVDKGWCRPFEDNKERGYCEGCGWTGPIEDAEITAVG